MVANFGAGGADIKVLGRHAGAEVVVVVVGVLAELDDHPALIKAKVRTGTANLAAGPAMTPEECRAALDAGAAVAAQLVAEREAGCLITGDMGIGNTTASAALIAALCGRSAEEVTGRGTGIDDRMLARKTEVVRAAVARVADDADPFDVLADVGGLEIAGLAGFIVGGASAGVPVIVDGVIAGAAMAAAVKMVPAVLGYCVAGHRSTEPGAAAVLEHLGVAPLLDLELRLGEGTGACLALSVVQASAKILREMATFDSAGVTDKT
jgi:nicotinate-nucleotide--dimethylbenzimidazole phosphoribosyltransferase